MKVTHKKESLVPVCDIDCGGVFREYDDYYIKTNMIGTADDGDNTVICVSIEEGRAEDFHPQSTVWLVDAECVVAHGLHHEGDDPS